MPLSSWNFQKLKSSLALVRPAAPAAPLDVQQRAKAIVNSVLTKHGLDPAICYDAEANLWILPTQAVPVMIRLIRIEPEATSETESANDRADKPGEQKQSIEAAEPEDFIEVRARLTRLPSYPLLAVYRCLLEMNMGCSQEREIIVR